MDSRYIPSDRLQFHILRHFTNPGEDYLSTFMKSSGYSRKEIEQQLLLPGSKFREDFASDPMKLWKIVQELISGNQFRAVYSSNRKIFSFEFEKELHPAGIGTCGLVKLSELTEEERQKVKEEIRNGFTVQTISNIAPRPSWEMHMVLLLSADPFIATIFPGRYAPPFPDSKNQDYEEYMDNEVFWKKHALVR
jgi:hypothetical protein